MSAALQGRPRLTVEEFIALIEPLPDDERWELLDGEAVLMSPPMERHQRVVSNLMAAVRLLARARGGCVALPGLGILNDAIDDYAPIPDVVVRCGPMLEGGYARDPVLLAEVLSPSTMNNDRGRKLDFYRTIASLQTILVVYADEVRLESWQRDGEGWAHVVLRDRAQALALPELGGTLAMSDLYEDVPIAT